MNPMKYLTVILLFVCCTSYAQTDTLQLLPDTLLNPVSQQIDSLQRSFTNESDSLRKSYVQQRERLGSLKLHFLHGIDSLKGKLTQPQTPENPFDSLKSNTDVNLYSKKIDSLDQQIASLEKRTTARLDSLKGKVNSQLAKLKVPKEAQGKIASLTSSMDKVRVPSFDTDAASRLGLNNLDIGLREMPGNGNLTSANIPNANLPSVNTDIPGMDVKSPDLKSIIPSTDINTGKIGEITGQAGDITGQAGEIQKQVKEATGSTEGLGKTLESKASEQVKGLPDQKLPEIEGLPGGVLKTSDDAKQQLANLAKKQAVNHFAGKEAVLTSAMEKMSKYKQKYSSVNSLKDIKDEKHHNVMKGKPLRERLVPAVTLQFQSWQDVMLDINPSVGYKFTSRFTAGIGWNQRVAFNIPQQQFNDEAKVYGIRTYGEYTLKKGFGFRLDVETMNTPAKENDPATDVVLPRSWVWGALVGIKQKYPIYKKLKGNAQLMYNIFDKDHRSPYLDRVNFRIGLELSLKKKNPTSSK
jgi:hypothetical protein